MRRMGGDPDILVDLTTARTEFEAQTIANALEAHGLEAKVFANVGSVLQWEVAVSQPIKVAVRRRDLEVARSILRTIRAESLDVDWSEVDTGDEKSLREAEVRVLMGERCPRCGYDLTGLDPSRSCPECGENQRARLERAVARGASGGFGAAGEPGAARGSGRVPGRLSIVRWAGWALLGLVAMSIVAGWGQWLAGLFRGGSR